MNVPDGSRPEEMIYAQPQYSVQEVNAASKQLRQSIDSDWENWSNAEWARYYRAIEIINNWRGSHAYPLNIFAVTLRNVSRRFEDSPLIAQRVKRLVSIALKLRLLPTMKLSQMQDLGGCRSILSDVAQGEASRGLLLQ